MNKKQKECKHENVSGTETYGVYGHYEVEEGRKVLYLKQGDGGLDNNLECEDCGLKFNNGESDCEFGVDIEFV